MENNDIGMTVHKHVACMFEDLLMHVQEEPEERKPLFGFLRRKEEELSEDEWVNRQMRRWRVNEMPMKSLIHMTTKLGISVEVYTFLDPIFVPHIEHWLARKGAAVTVWSYVDLNDLWEDFKYNRDVHTFFTTSQDDASRLGMRATVVNPDGTFGI